MMDSKKVSIAVDNGGRWAIVNNSDFIDHVLECSSAVMPVATYRVELEDLQEVTTNGSALFIRWDAQPCYAVEFIQEVDFRNKIV